MLIEANLTKAVLKNKDKGNEIRVMFNPNSLQFDKTVPWNEQVNAGYDAPEVQFTSGKPETLGMELFFDTFEHNISVKPMVDEVRRLSHIDGELHRPPMVYFIWNEFKFLGVITSVNTKYTLFLDTGAPVRATVTLKLRESLPAKEQKTKTKPQSPDHAKVRTLKRGETLHAIAAVEYDDPKEWRRIADANGIDDPLNLVPGQKLIIPPIIK